MIHSEGGVNVCATFHGNKSNNCCDISLKKHKCDPHGDTRRKVRGSPKSLGFIFWATWISGSNFIPIVVEMFQSGPKWWTDRPTFPSLEPRCYRTVRTSRRKKDNSFVQAASHLREWKQNKKPSQTLITDYYWLWLFHDHISNANFVCTRFLTQCLTRKIQQKPDSSLSTLYY